ncbi:MAG: SGNH/GDSL hydrolase family protein [Polyangiaceae bacterium]
MDRPSSTSNSEPVRRRFAWRKLPLGALFAFALLAAAELGTRAFFKPPYISVATYAGYYPLAALYGFEGSRACFRSGEQFTCARSKDMNIIPQTFPARKPAGEKRIVVVGSSVSWEGSAAGQGKSEDNYPSRTLAQLQHAHPERSLRLINLSVPGFGTTREVVRLREALEYEPDLLIVHVHDTNEIREDQRRAYVKSLHAGLAGKLLYLQSVVVLKEWWGEAFELPRSARGTVDTGNENDALNDAAKIERWTSGMKRNVQTMLDLAKAQSVPVVLVGPSRWDRRAGVRERPLNEYYSARAPASAAYLNVVELFRAEFARRHRPLFKDNVHYSAEGTRVIASALTPLIESALPELQAH